MFKVMIGLAVLFVGIYLMLSDYQQFIYVGMLCFTVGFYIINKNKKYLRG